jgi:NTP pyrophosphatase (non-canonical NTP hydrolase)
MTYTTKQFQVEAMKTKSPIFRPAGLSQMDWWMLLDQAQSVGDRAKRLKRATFSNKGEIKRFEQIQSFERNPDIVHAMLGVWNEAGELAQVAPGVLLNKPEALANADLEMADLLWFIALWCEGRGFDLETLMRMVIAKLRARHGEKFDSEKMDDANRDPDAENRAAENARNAQ